MRAIMIQITTDVTARNSNIPQKRDHDVRKVLTYTLPQPERVFDGRINRRAFFYVRESVVEFFVELTNDSKRIASVPLVDAQLIGKSRELW